MATRVDVDIVQVPVGESLPVCWPVSWSVVWVRVGPEDLGLPELVASICVAFFSFVIGGWAAARIAGFRRAEPAMLLRRN